LNSTNCPLLNGLPSLLADIESVLYIVNKLNESKMCSGNSDDKFIALQLLFMESQVRLGCIRFVVYNLINFAVLVDPSVCKLDESTFDIPTIHHVNCQ